ncbi:hypothetical protein SAY86_031925 [Trapa natans]|uniref:Uncharacterized protein n=1 Tax=Trapa natans TaxID=22666 RepID=A0AAN7M444_TRANT|nr:hypothetical protein SAY86_031925 [Trapa natans]
MDRESERLKLLGAFGMIGESFRVISARKKLFSQITLALILPLSLLLLSHSIVSDLVLDNSDGHDGSGTKRGLAVNLSVSVAYFTLVFLLSIIAIAEVAYATACVYASKDVTFGKITAATFKIWTRLAVTFLWFFLLYIAFTLVFALFFEFAMLLMKVAKPVGVFLGIVVPIAYLVGVFYITIVMQTASVMSVLEDNYGRPALKKSRGLLKGKLGSVVGYFLLIILCLGLIEFAFGILVATGYIVHSVVVRVVLGIFLWFLLVIPNLVCLVGSTVVYFVCKSHHGERIDMALLEDRLKVYREAKIVQLGQPQPPV